MLSYSLIDTYCHCDSIIGGRKLFEGLQVMDTVLWNSLVSKIMKNVGMLIKF
jgi:hypothetical protein